MPSPNPDSDTTPRSDRAAATPSLSCVIPCRNEARNLEALLPMLQQVLPGITPHWEVVLVDDGSTDRSHQILSAWAERPGFRALELSRNFGKEAALTAGLHASAGGVVVMMDADLQHPPALIADMVARWRAGADVVYAVRSHRDDENLIKRTGTWLFYRMLNRADRFEVPPGAGDFRLLDRAAVNALLALPERNRFMKGLYAWIGFDAVALPYVPAARAHGRSHFNLRRLVGLSLDGLTSFTTWPLRAASLLGVVLALAGFSYGAYLTLDYLLYGNPVSGWTTIVVSLLCFLSVQLISLGILGEYIGRIFEEVKARPIYVVKRELGQGLAPPHL